MRTVFYIAGKDLLRLWRDRLGFFWWMLGFPLLIAVLIGTLFAGMLKPPKPMDVAVVDEAGSPDSAEFTRLLHTHAGFNVRPMSAAAAANAVRRGSLASYVVLRPGFKISPDIFFGERWPLAIGADPTKRAEMAYLQIGVQKAGVESMRLQCSDPQRRQALLRAGAAAMSRAHGGSAAETRTVEGILAMLDGTIASLAGQPWQSPTEGIELIPLGPRGARPASSFEVCFPLGIIWGLIGVAAEFAIGIVQERQTGTLLRLRVAPISRLHMLAGSGLACLIAATGLVIFLLGVGRLVFGVRLQNPLGLAAAILCIGVCFTGLAAMLSRFGKTEAAVGGAAWACLLIFAMLGGGMVPQIFMPDWMDTATSLSPVKWAILAMEGGIWRNLSLAELVKPCAILLACGLAFGTIGGLLARRETAI